jgi:molecular chaperone HscB
MPRLFAAMNLSDDDFTLFGLPARYSLDRADLDERWRALQGQVHPDRFVAETGASQRLAMQWTLRVNEAHQRLKDPLKRAAYLCELRGAPLEAEKNTQMPASFLMQQMAWREALEEAHSPDEVRAIDADVQAHEQGLFAELQRTLDDGGDAHAAAQQVRALMFVARFRRDIDHRLEALGQ